MNKTVSIFLLTIILLCGIVEARGTGEENVRIVKASSDSWTCYDYSVDFAENNPGWGVVTISNNQLFRGVTHMVNYKLLSDERLSIHDGMFDGDYIICGWQYYNYYHFWINETPKRNYVMMRDNRNDVINTLKIKF